MSASGSSSWVSAIMRNGRSRIAVASESIDGNSSKQGGHHDAQKFRNTTSPRNALSETGLPFKSLTWKGGAGRSCRSPSSCWIRLPTTRS